MIKKFVLLCFLLVSISNGEMVTRVKVLMGTFASISLQKENKEFFSGVFKILKQIDNSLSSYKSNSPIYLLNKNREANINFYTYKALYLSEKYYKETDGYFDIAIGNITKDLYRFGEKERLVTSLELNKSDTSLSNLKFNKKEAFLEGTTKIDLGGMGKGFGVDKSIEYLKKHYILKSIVALSGDIRCLGRCKIEINNPLASESLAKFETKKSEMGISTSGNYNRYVVDTKHNHLINPKTKQSQNGFISVTLISQLDSSDLDAYSTAVSVMPPRKAYEFLDNLKIGYILLLTNKKLIISKNIEDYTEDLIINYTDK